MSVDDDVRIARRLVREPSAACWTGACVKVVSARSLGDPKAPVQTPDHYLAAAWPPGEAGWTRWPEAVIIGSPTPTRALEELLRDLPGDARLYLAGLDEVDAALASEILLAADRNLEAYQREALASFATAQRARTQAVIAVRYCDRNPGFERFRESFLGADPSAQG